MTLKRLNALEAKVNRLHYIEQSYPQLLSLARRDLWFFCMYSRQMLLMHCPKAMSDEGTGIIRGVLQDCPLQICSWDRKYGKQLAWLALAKLLFDWICRIRNAPGTGFEKAAENEMKKIVEY